MKPVQMKIKGVNSFLDLQEIDFRELARDGLFGIFGPTGSGKSSILDGITLALYGMTARNSANFIHVSTDRAFVEYLFSVREKKERLYRVSRSFKRSKEGGIRSDGAKLTEMTEKGEEVLADRVGAVNEKCREIIGLSKEDFFRTVVLPQGKFSEFLKLEGMERNKMLERLFHLEKYGEQLVFLIKNQEAAWDGKRREKEGALSSYGSASKEQIEELQKKEKIQTKLFKQKNEYLIKVRADLEEIRRLLTDQETLERLEKQELTLSAEKEEINFLEKELELAEKANELWEYVVSKKTAEKKMEDNRKKLEDIKTKLKEREEFEAECREQSRQIEKRMETELPFLKQRKEELEEAAQLSKECQQQEKIRQTLFEKKEKLELQISHIKDSWEKAEQAKAVYKEEKEELNRKLREIFVSAQQQNQSEEGFRLLKEKEVLDQRIASEKEKFAQLSALSKDAVKQWETYKKQEQFLEKEAAGKKIKIQNLQEQLEQFSGLEEKRNYLAFVKAEQEREKQFLKQEDTYVKSCLALKAELKKAGIILKETEKEREQAQKVYRDHLGLILFAGLKEGEPCPVCGSTRHVKKPKKETQENLQKLEKKVKEAEEAYQRQAESIVQLQTRLEGESKNLERIRKERNQLNSEYIKENLEELKNSYENLCREEEFLAAEEKKKKILLEKEQQEAQKAQAQAVKWETEAAGYQKQAEEVQDMLFALEEQRKEKQKFLENLESVSGIRNFAEAYPEIRRKNQIRDALQKKQEKLLARIEQIEIESRETWEQMDRQKENLTEIRFQIQEADLQFTRLSQRLLETAKGLKEEELAAACRQVTASIESLRKQEEQTKESLQTAALAADRLRLEKGKLEAVTEETEKDYILQADILKEKLKENQAEGETWILEHRKSPEEREAGAHRISLFQKEMLQVQIQKEAVLKSLGGKRTDKEEEAAFCREEKQLQELVNQLSRELGALIKEKEQLIRDWQAKASLKEELDQILHRLDLLKELDSLFKGKKFVEYVSRYYLEYISREADTCLKDMTGNAYGMETDGNGMFIIRDYKNGGAVRPASTLSGGETFMASLALALALSSGIQMKGAAPMELFFLDEGFGTLDETCLDIVMEALEKVRTKKRSVGIITHVEEIKARIPTRLIVEAARPGEGGSRVHMEQI